MGGGTWSPTGSVSEQSADQLPRHSKGLSLGSALLNEFSIGGLESISAASDDDSGDSESEEGNEKEKKKEDEHRNSVASRGSYSSDYDSDGSQRADQDRLLPMRAAHAGDGAAAAPMLQPKVGTLRASFMSKSDRNMLASLGFGGDVDGDLEGREALDSSGEDLDHEIDELMSNL